MLIISVLGEFSIKDDIFQFSPQAKTISTSVFGSANVNNNKNHSKFI